MIGISILQMFPAFISADYITNIGLFLSKMSIKFILPEEKLFIDALNYSLQNKVVLDLTIFTNFLLQQPLGDKDRLIYLRKFSEASKEQIANPKFLSLLEHFLYEIRKQIFTEKLIAASLALEKGFYDEESKILYAGLDDAQELISQAIVGNSSSKDRFPQGDVLKEGDAILVEYENITTGTVKGILSGFNVIDKAIGAFQKGDMILVGAFTGEGKSMFLVNLAHHISIVQAKNAVVVTAETLRPQYRRRLITRHSCLPKFGLPLGLPSMLIRDGQLDISQQLKFKEIVNDFTSNPNYGYLNIMQVTAGATLKDIQHELEIINSNIPLDIAFIDYLSLLSPGRNRSKRQDEKVELIQAAKELAITFNHGVGIPLISAHQFSSEARAHVQPIAGKFYTLRDFADTSETAKSCDVAIGLLRTEELKNTHELCCGFLKIRDGEVPGLFRLFENYSSSYIGDLSSSSD